MNPAIRQIVTWSIGFVLVSTVYLAVGFWLINRRRRAKASRAADQRQGAAEKKGGDKEGREEGPTG